MDTKTVYTLKFSENDTEDYDNFDAAIKEGNWWKKAANTDFTIIITKVKTGEVYNSANN